MDRDDTKPEARLAQIEALRNLGPEGRLRLTVQMIEDARNISIEGYQRRDPRLTREEATLLLARHILGEELSNKVWPKATRA
ncbi:MAG: hypothetical protein KBF88_00085 [Polyangiaceae bacterium]|nr:hypothetical protein [Polyangiaceae bacterium]